MSNLKSLAETIGMGFTPRNSKTKTRLGLHHFVAATTDQMLMTRGGYGAKTRIACVHGNPGQCDRFPCNLTPYTGGGINQARLYDFTKWALDNNINLDHATFKNFAKGLTLLAKLRKINPWSFIFEGVKAGPGLIPEDELRERFIRDSIFLNQNNP